MADIAALLDELVQSPDYRGQIAAVRELPARAARYAAGELELCPAVRMALQRQGIGRLYVHQEQAIRAAMEGRHVAVAAGTASGKTVCFLVPIAEAIAQRATSRALLIYPTKALAQDQKRKLAAYGAGETFVAETYDGDTPQHLRRDIRRRTHVVLTNPDMLHVGILPYHSAWRELFGNLRYVVVDEMHVYTGVFGAHTANVMRRLRRVAEHYGSRPVFICCSATVGNPGELAERLTGQRHVLVADDGSPQGRKLLVLWNPPIIQRGTGRRRSPNMEAAELLAWLVRRGVRTIVFTLARSQTELVYRYARERLGDGLGDAIMPYRGGYLPRQRRAIEQQLFDGSLRGVVATSALELGIDIGGLDAAIIVGYPGRLSSLWQRAGRAGRRQDDSLAILIARETSVDQYLISHPDYLLEHGNERVLVNPSNPYILAGHLMCAAREIPVAEEELGLFGGRAAELLGLLEEERYVVKRQRWHWIDPELYPAGQISIRSASGAGYDIVVREGGGERLLGSIDDRSAPVLVHPGAVYLHEGETYVVRELDVDGRRVVVVREDVSYYTQAISISQVTVIERETEIDGGAGLKWCLGTALVTSQVVGYRKVEQVTERRLGEEELDLPEQSYETQALWMVIGAEEQALLRRHGHDLLGSLHGLEHAMIAIVPLFAQCDTRDIGGVSHPQRHDVGGPAVFVYDGYPGGVGIADGAFERLGDILAAVAEMVEACPCEAGCPSCVQSPECGDDNWPLDKKGAARLARHLAERWQGLAAGRRGTMGEQ